MGILGDRCEKGFSAPGGALIPGAFLRFQGHQIPGFVELFRRDVIRLHHEARLRCHIDGSHIRLAGVHRHQHVLHVADQRKLFPDLRIIRIRQGGIKDLDRQLPVLFRIGQGHGPRLIFLRVAVDLLGDRRRDADSPLKFEEKLVCDLRLVLRKLHHPDFGLLGHVGGGLLPGGLPQVPVGGGQGT